MAVKRVKARNAKSARRKATSKNIKVVKVNLVGKKKKGVATYSVATSKKKKRVVKKYKQTGVRRSLRLDKMRKAKIPGWRRSKSGGKYFESQKNRSDIRGKKI